MTITTNALEDAEGQKEIWTKSSEVSFKLSDIDPSTVKVVPHSSRWMTDCTNPDEVKASRLDCDTQAEVLFSARNEDKVMTYKSDVVYPKLKGLNTKLIRQELSQVRR